MRRPFALALLAALGAAALLTACHDRKWIVSDRRPSAPIDSRIVLTLHERFDSTGRWLVLDGATERIYPCSNYSIVFDRRVSGATTAIRFTGVFIPPVCLTALGPASCRIPLGPPATGAHPLLFTLDEKSLGARLDVTDDRLTIEAKEQDWLSFAVTERRRVPDGAIWGLIGWGPADRSARAQAFLDSLAVAGVRPLALAAGDYDDFKVAADGSVTLPGDHGYYFERGFALGYSGDLGALAGIVGAFGDVLQIAVYDTRGRHLYSWMLRGTAAPQGAGSVATLR